MPKPWVSFKSGSNADRVEFFSDAVFAIALTLLVFDLRLPEVEFESNEALAAGIVELLTGYIGFVVSFGVIALNWMLHHEKFQVIERWDTTLVRVNFLVLLFVAFLPFPTAVFSGNPLMPVAISLYAFSVAALSLSQGLVWWVACRRGLVRRDVPAEVRRAVATRGLPVIIGFVVVGVACWVIDPRWSLALLVLLAPAQLLRRRFARADLERRYPAEEPDTPGADGVDEPEAPAGAAPDTDSAGPAARSAPPA